MPKLIIKKDLRVVKKLAIPEDILAFTIGSEQGNDIIISEDRISYFHLQFEQQNGRYFVRDLQSQGGTFVNGMRIATRTRIRHGDEIGLGGHKITFIHANHQQSGVGHHVPAAPAKPKTQTNGAAGELQLSFNLRELRRKISPAPALNQLNDWLNEPTVLGDPVPQAPPEIAADKTDQSTDMPFAPQLALGSDGNGRAADSAPEHVPDHSSDNGNQDMVLPTASVEPDRTESPELIITPTEALTEIPATGNPVLAPPQPGMAATPSGHEQNYYLLGINGHYLGRKFRIRKSRTRIGRDAKLNDIVIRKNSSGELDQSVSRRHATISFKKDQYLLSDKRSQTRTRLNQQVILPNDQVAIRPGDEIEIISDRKNHIFRFVEEGDWDFSYPRKAGSWLLRNRMRLLTASTLLVVALALTVAVRSYLTVGYLTDVNPDISYSESVWYDNRDAIAATSTPFPANSPAFPAVAITDVNKDDYVDLVYSDVSGSLRCVDGQSKEIIWQNTDFQTLGHIPVTVEDWFNDGLPDLLVVSSDLRVRAIDGRWGAEIWKSPMFSGPITAPPLIADLNGDGLQDVALAAESATLYIGYASVEKMNWVRLNLNDQVRSVPSLLSYTNSRIPHIVLGTESGRLIMINGKQRSITLEIDIGEELNKAAGRYDLNAPVRAPVAVADLNGDGNPDYVVTTATGNIIAFESSTHQRLWFDLADEGGTPDNYGRPSTVLGDLDGDGLADVATLTPNGNIRALKGTGLFGDKLMLLWRSGSDVSGAFSGNLVLTDLNKNGTQDVIATGRDGTISVFEGATGKRLLQSTTKPAVSGVPLIADMGNNHTIDILTLRRDNRFHLLTTDTKTVNAAVFNSQLFGDSQRTNYYNLVKEDAGKYRMLTGVSLLLVVVAIGLNWSIRKKRSKLNYY